jgi:hypothetical protein
MIAPAQGILSQVRLLGGSLGIAASTALLHQKVTKYLVGVLTPQQLQTLGGDEHLSQSQLEKVRFAYAESFRTDMKVAVGVAAVGLVVTLGAYRRQRLLIRDQRNELVAEEIARRRAKSEQSQPSEQGGKSQQHEP